MRLRPVHPLVLSREQIHLMVTGRRTLVLLPHTGDGQRPPHAVGSRVAVQSRPSRPAVCHVSVTRAREVMLGDLDDPEAHELGCRDVDELMAAWVERHGLWNENDKAWLLHVKVDPSACARLLRPTAGRHGRRALLGYTTQRFEAMPDEPEAVDDFAIAAKQRAAEAAATARFQQLLAERRRMPDHERLRIILAEAEEARVRPSRELHVIRQRMEALERKIHRPAEIGLDTPS